MKMASFSKNSLCGIVFAIFMAGGGLCAAEKLSLKELSEQLKNPEQITELFKVTEPFSKVQAKERQKIFKENDKNHELLLKTFRSIVNFHRGEIEDEKVLNGVIQYLQLSLLKVRVLSEKSNSKNWQEIEEIFKSWFQFTADFPYEEASLVGLRATSVLRSFLFDELEKMQLNHAQEIAKKDYLRSQIFSLRAPWPIDRVVITEGKKILSSTLMQVAEKLALDLQKNPYQTSEAALKKIRGGAASDLQFLKEIWREKDIDLMKTEINRIGRFKIALASAIFEEKKQQKPTSVDELVALGFLDRVPLDYKTGKPMSL